MPNEFSFSLALREGEGLRGLMASLEYDAHEIYMIFEKIRYENQFFYRIIFLTILIVFYYFKVNKLLPC